jgi:hypothetical protein
MSFTCENEIVISGGTEEERVAATRLLLAADSIDEDSVSSEDGEATMVLRCESVDGLPESEARSLAVQFPELSFLMAYFSKDGEFYGYARAGKAGEAAESADFEEGTLEEVGRRYGGDGLAFVRDLYSLARREE